MSETNKWMVAYWLDTQETENGVIVKLYSDHPGVQHPVVKLYDTSLSNPQEDLTQIPPSFLKEIQKRGISKDGSTPKKEKALRDGDLHSLPNPVPFFVQINRDGTTSKRVDWGETKNAWAGRSPAGIASEASERAVYEGMTERHMELLELAAQETFEIARQALLSVNHLYEEQANNEEADTGPDFLNQDELFKTLFYRIAKTFDMVRGAWVVPEGQSKANQFQKIQEGQIDTLATDIAAGRDTITSDDMVRDIIKELGIQITKVHVDDVNERVNVAKQVWFYVDLQEEWGLSESQAKEIVDQYLNGIPW